MQNARQGDFCNYYRKVAQLVAHYVRDVGVGRSSRLFPTSRSIDKFVYRPAFLYIDTKNYLHSRHHAVPSAVLHSI